MLGRANEQYLRLVPPRVPPMPPIRNPRRTRRVIVAYVAAKMLMSVQKAVGTYKKVYYDNIRTSPSVLMPLKAS